MTGKRRAVAAGATRTQAGLSSRHGAARGAAHGRPSAARSARPGGAGADRHLFGGDAPAAAAADLDDGATSTAPTRFAPDTPLSASKNYLDLKHAATGALPPGVHFTLIEAVADHICETLFLQDARVRRVEVKIVKLAIAEAGESIGDHAGPAPPLTRRACPAARARARSSTNAIILARDRRVGRARATACCARAACAGRPQASRYHSSVSRGGGPAASSTISPAPPPSAAARRGGAGSTATPGGCRRWCRKICVSPSPGSEPATWKALPTPVIARRRVGGERPRGRSPRTRASSGGVQRELRVGRDQLELARRRRRPAARTAARAPSCSLGSGRARRARRRADSRPAAAARRRRGSARRRRPRHRSARGPAGRPAASAPLIRAAERIVASAITGAASTQVGEIGIGRAAPRRTAAAGGRRCAGSRWRCGGASERQERRRGEGVGSCPHRYADSCLNDHRNKRSRADCTFVASDKAFACRCSVAIGR